MRDSLSLSPFPSFIHAIMGLALKSAYQDEVNVSLIEFALENLKQ